jgi:hypothetical protein
MLVVYKIDKESKYYSVVASVLIFECAFTLIAVVANLKVNLKIVGKGLGSKFFADLAGYMERETKGKLYQGCGFVA